MKLQNLLFCALLAVFSSAAQAGLLIDSFDVGPGAVEDNVDGLGGDSLFDVFCGASCIGEYRDINADRLSEDFPTSGSTSLKVEFGTLQFSNDTGVVGTGFVLWDGLAGAGLGGIDFLAEGNAFVLDVVAVDLGLELDLIVADLFGNSFTQPVIANVNVPGDVPSPLEVVVPFQPFIDNGVDMSLVDGVGMFFNAGAEASLDLTIDTVSTVPAPAPLVLLGLGLLGLAGVRKVRA